MHIANYKEHREAFSTLLKQDCDKPILLFKGESGTGKSTLMKHCRQLVKDKNRQYLYLDFKESTTNIMQVFDKLANKLDLDGMGGLLNDKPNITVTGNTQTGFGNMVNVELNYNNQEQWNNRLIQLTKALLKRIAVLETDFILLMDAYEKTNSEIQKWVQSELLPRAEDYQRLRIIIAGQTVPNQNAEWEDYCEHKELHGVHDAEEWLPVIESMGRKLDSLDMFKCFCRDYMKGNPSEIVRFIETFPRIS